MRNTWAVLIAMAGSGLLAFGLGLGFAVAKDTGQSSANFYAKTSDGECELNFTITYHNETIKGRPSSSLMASLSKVQPSYSPQ
jgi:hypothetical protein